MTVIAIPSKIGAAMNLGYIHPVISPHKETTWEEEALAKVQSQLTPKDAKKIVAIRLESDGFALGMTTWRHGRRFARSSQKARFSHMSMGRQ